MISKPEAELLDLERDLHTTAADVEALRRHRPGPMDGHAYLRFLASLPPPSWKALRVRPGPRGERPFEL